MVFIIVALEQLICLVWILALSPPDVEIGFNDQISRVLSCNFGSTSKGLAIWTSYNAGKMLHVSLLSLRYADFALMVET